MINVLIADDNENLRTVVVNELSAGGYNAAGAESGTKSMELLEQDEYDVVLLDLNMPGMDGMDVLKKMKTLDLPAEVIILTAHSTVSTAVEAMKLGAYDYLTKPFKVEELKAVIEKAFERKKLLGENQILKARIKRQTEPHRIITASPLMLEVLETVKKVALSDLPVLVWGESGTGKELVAGAIHEASQRAEGPFVPLNCGAIPESMLESEIFGYEKGAFTGADAKKPGLLEVADRGTLFLDEIGELPRQLQVKLLRVVETGRFFRLGGTREVRVDVKYVSATNKDLKKEIGTGGFRSDLYYRISALTITVPPLRERPEDIPLLVESFVKGSPAFRNKTFTEEAMRALCAYPWPGNVRELQNVIHRAALLAKGDVIGRSDLSADLSPAGASSGRRLEDVERDHILMVLRETGGERGKTAEVLDISPKTLYRKLKSYGVTE